MSPPFIPPKTKERMKKYGILDREVMDVFKNGIQREGQFKKYKKFKRTGETIQISFLKNDHGEDIITWVNKW